MTSKKNRMEAETRFRRLQRTDEEARAIVEADLDALRYKTACLKAQRLAKEPVAGTADVEKKRSAQTNNNPESRP